MSPNPIPNKNIKVPVVKVRVFKDEMHFSKWKAALFALVFAGIGGYFVWHSFAASPIVATVQAEQISPLPDSASVINDSTASNGKAVKFSQNNGIISTPVSLPSKATSVSVVAHGTKCKGHWPTMKVSIDGSVIMDSGAVSSNSWQNYTSTVSLSNTTHALSIQDTSTSSCRYLYIDEIVFYGPTTVTPAPTISFSASPASVSSGSSTTLTWNTANANSCSASGAWSGTEPTSGSVTTGALSTNSTYNLSCSGTGGSVNSSVTVNVTSSNSIYWGAVMDGNDTYSYYYGNPAPNGQPWTDAPWANTGNTWDRFEQNAGKKVSILSYGQPPPWVQTTFYGDVANIITNRGAIPFLTMGQSGSDDLAGIAAGKYDTQIKAWAANVKTYGKPLFLRLWWEMNGNWYSWGSNSSASTYIAAWQRVHNDVVSQGATNVTWVWCPNIGSTAEANARYPGDSYVDWTCLDGYNKGTATNSFSNLFSASYQNLLTLAPTKPIIIGEISSQEYGSGVKANWITDALGTQLPTNFPKIKGVIWFNWRINEPIGSPTWWPFPIESSDTSKAAFAKAIANPYYAPNNYGNLPLLTKVQPPK